jgi:hypothetical protein
MTMLSPVSTGIEKKPNMLVRCSSTASFGNIDVNTIEHGINGIGAHDYTGKLNDPFLFLCKYLLTCSHQQHHNKEAQKMRFLHENELFTISEPSKIRRTERSA